MVRWQTQDADAAQLRDQIRQAARTWDQHERSDDLLWTGSAYREFAVCRERYPGRLSETEEDFASAMTSHAKWRKRRRRIVAVAALMVAAVLAGVFGVLWRQSEREARRAEAANLLSLGQLELESYPSATIAYTIASLELADNVGARRLALEALWRGPTALVVNDESSWAAEFTPDGRSLVQGGDGTGHIRLIHSDGTSELLEHRHETDRINIRMGLDSDVFFSYGFFGKPSLPFIGLWSANEGRMLGGAEYEGPVRLLRGVVSAGQQRLVYMVLEGELASIDTLGFDGTRERLGRLDFGFGTWRDWIRRTDLERQTGRWLGAVVDNDVLVIEIGEHGLSAPRRLGRHEEPVRDVLFDPLGRFFATIDEDGGIRLWRPDGASPPTILDGPPGGSPWVTDDGSFLSSYFVEEKKLKSWVWSLNTDPPRLLRRFDLGQSGIGNWWVDSAGRRLIKCGPDLKIRLWPVARFFLDGSHCETVAIGG
jgi:WD40 repeat protein